MSPRPMPGRVKPIRQPEVLGIERGAQCCQEPGEDGVSERFWASAVGFRDEVCRWGKGERKVGFAEAEASRAAQKTPK